MKAAISLLAALSVALGARAGDNAPADAASQTAVRPVLTAVTFGIGSSHLADSYLSPLKYTGWSTSAHYERWQAMKRQPERWITRLDVEATFDRTMNPARNATMLGIEVRASWGAARRWTPCKELTLGAGASVRAEGGCLYNGRNSNNPASAKAAVTLDATAYAAWSTRIGRLPLTLLYRPTLPVIGAFFSPSYDELYFEIYMGNRHGLVHPAWWGNRFRLDQRLTADIRLGANSLRIGYESSWMNSKTEGLVTRMITHRFVIGWTTEWIGLRPAAATSIDKARIISALY